MTNDVSAIRLPWWARLYAAVFSVVWCIAVAVGGVTTFAHRPVAVVIPLLMLAFGGTLGYRLARLAVIADADGLTVHNYFGTHRVAHSDVAGFRVGRAGVISIGRSIHVRLRGHPVLRLDVTTEPYNLTRSRARLQRRLEDLQRWQADRA